jgi:CDP-diacylglycerol--glycerol-3-phosphate 3-phosphatidyltransferase
MSAAFISLVELDLAPAWMVTCIIGREFAVTGLRVVALQANIPIAANAWGKAKTIAQVIAVSVLILGKKLGQWIFIGHALLWIALALTLISMVIYFRRNWGVLKENEE